MNLPDILANTRPQGDHWASDVPANWLQGRTCYGGLSSAIAHHVARATAGDPPPLRSAQVAFIGPIPAGPVRLTAELLRQGKNTAFVETRLFDADGNLGFMGTFIFMHPRTSRIAHSDLPMPPAAPPPADGEGRSGPPAFFTNNFEYPASRATLATGKPAMEAWHRLKVRDGVDPMTELLSIGDALPPAAMGLLKEFGPISSMNWHVNMLTDAPATDNGWWYLHSIADQSGHGASSQRMTVWNTRGEAVMASLQSVALFV